MRFLLGLALLWSSHSSLAASTQVEIFSFPADTLRGCGIVAPELAVKSSGVLLQHQTPDHESRYIILTAAAAGIAQGSEAALCHQFQFVGETKRYNLRWRLADATSDTNIFEVSDQSVSVVLPNFAASPNLDAPAVKIFSGMRVDLTSTSGKISGTVSSAKTTRVVLGRDLGFEVSDIPTAIVSSESTTGLPLYVQDQLVGFVSSSFIGVPEGKPAKTCFRDSPANCSATALSLVGISIAAIQTRILALLNEQDASIQNWRFLATGEQSFSNIALWNGYRLKSAQCDKTAANTTVLADCGVAFELQTPDGRSTDFPEFRGLLAEAFTKLSAVFTNQALCVTGPKSITNVLSLFEALRDSCQILLVDKLETPLSTTPADRARWVLKSEDANKKLEVSRKQLTQSWNLLSSEERTYILHALHPLALQFLFEAYEQYGSDRKKADDLLHEFMTRANALATTWKALSLEQKIDRWVDSTLEERAMLTNGSDAIGDSAGSALADTLDQQFPRFYDEMVRAMAWNIGGNRGYSALRRTTWNSPITFTIPAGQTYQMFDMPSVTKPKFIRVTTSADCFAAGLAIKLTPLNNPNAYQSNGGYALVEDHAGLRTAYFSTQTGSRPLPELAQIHIARASADLACSLVIETSDVPVIIQTPVTSDPINKSQADIPLHSKVVDANNFGCDADTRSSKCSFASQLTATLQIKLNTMVYALRSVANN